jgi:hypothetical protein
MPIWLLSPSRISVADTVFDDDDNPPRISILTVLFFAHEGLGTRPEQ